MAETNKEIKSEEIKTTVDNAHNNANAEFKKNRSKVRPKRKKGERGEERDEKEFEQKIINIRRVTRMFYGGRRMRLSVFLVVGDGKGRVGLGIGKGPDVRSAQEKAYKHAVKNLITVDLKGNTIPHDVTYKYGAARLLMRPAAPGTGVVAGSSMRMVAEVAGIKDVLGKIFGTNNKISNAYATIEALKSLRSTRL